MAGFAVIDLETTGFAYNRTDRVCDVRLLLDRNVRREHAWTTLINPQRDLGPSTFTASTPWRPGSPPRLRRWPVTSRTCSGAASSRPITARSTPPSWPPVLE